jgi:cation:H+ antiporter
MLLTYLEFIIGFVFLIFAAKWLVEGSTSIARKLNISDLIIGLTVVSFGTSAPELIINVISSFTGKPDLAIGNIMGSNISNILLILGVTAMITNLPVQRSTILSEIPFSLMAALLFGFLANTALFNSSEVMMISRNDGYMLLFFFLLFLMYIIYMAKQNQDIESEDIGELTMGKAMVYVGLGMVGLFAGGHFVVDSAVDIALSWGFSESFIGLTIVGVGTSLPELVTSVIAALKRNTDIAVGNVIGSNIFNLLWILGVTAVIHPLQFNEVSNTDILVIIFASTLMIMAMVVGKKYTIERWQGLLFIIFYVSYIYYLIVRDPGVMNLAQ